MERKSRSEAKKKAALASPLVTIDEQRRELLPGREGYVERTLFITSLLSSREIPLREIGATRESSAIVPAGAQDSSSSITRVDSQGNLTSETRKRLGSKSSNSDTPVVASRKDATYQGSLHNIPLYNEDRDEYNRQVITTSNDVPPKKSFFAQVAEQIDLNLLRDGAFALFAVSNFLTSLGFNVPYIFAKDLATDAQVPEKHQNWPIMTIGIANCFGRVIIGFIGDRPWVRDRETETNVLTLTEDLLVQSTVSLQYDIDRCWSGDDRRALLQFVHRHAYGLCRSFRILLRRLCRINVDYRRGFSRSG